MSYVLFLVGIYLLISYIYSKFKKISFLHGCANILIGFFEMIFSSDSSINNAERELKNKGADTPENMEKIAKARAANEQMRSTINTAKNKKDEYFDSKK